MSLRQRLIALADANDDAMSGTDWAEHKMRYIVLAAAKLALEDAESLSRTAFNRAADGDEIADAIRSLHDGL